MDPQALFDSLSISRLRGFIRLRQEEHLNLDFKLVTDATLSATDDKKNFAKALSGFANSSGGIIVWGIDARKTSTGLNCAIELREIENVKSFVARLNELTGDAVSPLVSGVLHRSVLTRRGNGFAATYVPESASGPHMARLGEDRYFKRSGDSFYKMEHFDIEDMFARRRKPRLIFTWKIRGRRTDAQIIVGLRNDGRSSARAPYLAFGCSPPFRLNDFGLDGNRNEGMHRLRFTEPDLPYRYGEGTNFVIHPGIEHEVASLYLGFSSPRLPTEDVLIRYVHCAEETPLTRNELTIPLAEIA